MRGVGPGGKAAAGFAYKRRAVIFERKIATTGLSGFSGGLDTIFTKIYKPGEVI
jgi:hypothetical protein